MQADSVDQLIVRILRTIEEGYTPTNERTRQDESLTDSAGGIQALRLMYHWHPSFQEMTNVNKSDNFLGNLDNTSKDASHTGTSAHTAHEETVLSAKVKENLGDQQWLALGGYAESVLEDTKTTIRRSIQATMEEIGDQGHKSEPQDFNKSNVVSGGTVASNPMEYIESLMKLLDGQQANRKSEKIRRDKSKKTESAIKNTTRVPKSDEGADDGGSVASSASDKVGSVIGESKEDEFSTGHQGDRSDRSLDLLPTYMLGEWT